MEQSHGMCLTELGQAIDWVVAAAFVVLVGGLVEMG